MEGKIGEFTSFENVTNVGLPGSPRWCHHVVNEFLICEVIASLFPGLLKKVRGVLSKVVEINDGELYIKHLVIDNHNHNKEMHRMSRESIL